MTGFMLLPMKAESRTRRFSRRRYRGVVELGRQATHSSVGDSSPPRTRWAESHRVAAGIRFGSKHQRVSAVITKLAQGHVLYELHEPYSEATDAGSRRIEAGGRSIRLFQPWPASHYP